MGGQEELNDPKMASVMLIHNHTNYTSRRRADIFGFFYNFIYFIFSCVGSSLLRGLFSSCGESGLFSRCRTRAPLAAEK